MSISISRRLQPAGPRSSRSLDELAGHVDAALRHVDRADRVPDHRHEQRRAALLAALTSSASQEGSSIMRDHGPERALAVDAPRSPRVRAPTIRPRPSAGAAAAVDGQLEPAQRLGRLAVLDALAGARSGARRCRRGARSRSGAPADRAASAAEREQPRTRPRHVEAAVEAVRTPDPTRGAGRRGAPARRRSIDDVDEHAASARRRRPL